MVCLNIFRGRWIIIFDSQSGRCMKKVWEHLFYYNDAAFDRPRYTVRRRTVSIGGFAYPPPSVCTVSICFQSTTLTRNLCVIIGLGGWRLVRAVLLQRGWPRRWRDRRGTYLVHPVMQVYLFLLSILYCYTLFYQWYFW